MNWQYEEKNAMTGRAPPSRIDSYPHEVLPMQHCPHLARSSTSDLFLSVALFDKVGLQHIEDT
jgi:hypothetical protein